MKCFKNVQSRLFCSAFVAAVLCSAAQAKACGPVIDIQYYESAPDVISIHNRSEQAWSLTTLTFNLTTSRGAVIFDTAFGGPGENESQAFEIVSGTARIIGEPSVTDGGSVLLMLFAAFGPGTHLDFAIDLDDRLTPSPLGQTVVVGEEIQGGEVTGILRSPEGNDIDVRGVFTDKSQAQLTALTCV